jgi:NTE family protein
MSKRPRSVSRKVQADPPAELNGRVDAALVFSGGMGLGDYHAGALEALQGASHIRVNWFAGSSVGAVTAALIAGCNTDPVNALRQFWGIVSKRIDAAYKSGRSQTWLKVKNPEAPGRTRFKA